MKKVGTKLMSLLMVALMSVTCTGCGVIRVYQNIGEAIFSQFKPTPRHEETLAEAFILFTSSVNSKSNNGFKASYLNQTKVP